jgi:hypothetical protein
VFNHDVAGITLSYKINNNVSVAAFWARPYNDNGAAGTIGGANYAAGEMDNADAFGLVVPLSFDGFKITPWGMLAAIGPQWNNTADTPVWDANANAGAGGYVRGRSALEQSGAVGRGLTPAFYGSNKYANRTMAEQNYFTAWWVGLTGEITAADPFRFAWDANYGSVSHVDRTYLNRSGWWINLLAEYKLDWGVPGLIAWWGSGDDGDIKNGSERLPIFNIGNSNLMLSTFGFNGGYYSNVTDGVTLNDTYAGSWGIGLRVRDMSFLEDLKHTVRVNLMGGTNDPQMAKYITGKKHIASGATAEGGLVTDFNSGGTYLTTLDYALEVNVDSIYKIYENLDLLVELGYIHVWLDQSRGVWGSNPTTGTRGVSVTDAVKASVFFRYSF